MTTDHALLMHTLLTALHACPERSGCEVRTRSLLQDFLAAHTTLELHDCGEGFYAAYRSADAPAGIALRADYDALLRPDGSCAHLCGHDGHAAALCGAALMLMEVQPRCSVFLLFQPAEETGAGAEGCCALFEKEQVTAIYGAHNLPGIPLGQVVCRRGTFACGSLGMTLSFHGQSTHAAYPEHGVNPAGAVGSLLCALPRLSTVTKEQGMVLCTVIGVSMGEKAFGAAAADGEVWLTLRAEREQELEQLCRRVRSEAERLAARDGLTLTITEADVFPATENHAAHADKVLRLCHGEVLPVPMRWSEDFGHYLTRCPGAFFGIGAGEDQPPLHTADYVYPEALLEPTVDAFMKLIEGE